MNSTTTIREIGMELWDKLKCMTELITSLDHHNDDENVKSEKLEILKYRTKDLEQLCQRYRNMAKDECETQRKLRELTGQINVLSNFASMMLDNINAKEENSLSSHLPCASTLGSSSVSLRMSFELTPVNDEEFNSISSYMKGRLTLVQINDFIKSFNKSLLKKYEIMKKPMKNLKIKEKTLQDLLKKQNTDFVKGMRFVTIDDMKEFSNLKVDRANSNILTILRHLKKIKEIREPAMPVRYALQF